MVVFLIKNKLLLFSEEIYLQDKLSIPKIFLKISSNHNPIN